MMPAPSRRSCRRRTGRWRPTRTPAARARFCAGTWDSNETRFPDSSMVEHAAVNRGVRGSSPRRGARSVAQSVNRSLRPARTPRRPFRIRRGSRSGRRSAHGKGSRGSALSSHTALYTLWMEPEQARLLALPAPRDYGLLAKLYSAYVALWSESRTSPPGGPLRRPTPSSRGSPSEAESRICGTHRARRSGCGSRTGTEPT